MGRTEMERVVRLIVVRELTLLAKVLGGQSAANSYALASLRADQERETAERAERR
jgi:hypothetical protein